MLVFQEILFLNGAFVLSQIKIRLSSVKIALWQVVKSKKTHQFTKIGYEVAKHDIHLFVAQQFS